MIYVVSYSINPKRDISNLLAELQRPPAGWMHYLDETWLIATNETSEQLYTRLVPHLTKRDLILIMQFLPEGSYYGWVPKQAWEWIEQYKRY